MNSSKRSKTIAGSVVGSKFSKFVLAILYVYFCVSRRSGGQRKTSRIGFDCLEQCARDLWRLRGPRVLKSITIVESNSRIRFTFFEKCRNPIKKKRTFILPTNVYLRIPTLLPPLYKHVRTLSKCGRPTRLAFGDLDTPFVPFETRRTYTKGNSSKIRTNMRRNGKILSKLLLRQNKVNFSSQPNEVKWQGLLRQTIN